MNLAHLHRLILAPAYSGGGGTYTQTLRYATGSTRSYSGNIGGMDWRGADNISRGYAYTYGADGTLLQRVSREPSGLLSPLSPGAVPTVMTETVENHIGGLTFRKDALWRIETPVGYISGDGSAHYYIRDHQGNVRQVTDAGGNVEQDSHYYPYGMLMGESGDILATARAGRRPLVDGRNRRLFGSKEYLTTAGANLLDFTARTYDPSTLLFHTPDPLRDKYLSVHAHLYCLGNPINFTDPSGRIVKYEGENKEKLKTLIAEGRKDKLFDSVFNELEMSNVEFTFQFGVVESMDPNKPNLGVFNIENNTVTLSNNLDGVTFHEVIAEESYHAYQTITPELNNVNIEYEAQIFAYIHTINLGMEHAPPQLLELCSNMENYVNIMQTTVKGNVTLKCWFSYKPSFCEIYKGGFDYFLNYFSDHGSQHYTNKSDLVPYRLLRILMIPSWLPKN